MGDPRAEALWRWFMGKTSAYVVQQSDGKYLTNGKLGLPALTPDDMEKHVAGTHTLAIYTVAEDHTVGFGMIDFDSKAPPAKERLLWIKSCLTQFGLPSYIEGSGSKGYHLWVVFKGRLPAYKVQWLMKDVVKRAEQELGAPRLNEYNKSDWIEVNPKQASGAGFGSAVKLPWGVHRKTGRHTTLINEEFNAELPNHGLDALEAQPPVTLEDLDAIIAEFCPMPAEPEQKDKTDWEHSEEFCEIAVEKMMEHCAFLKHCRDDAASLIEPHWWSMIRQLVPFGAPGRRKIHELSQAYPKYSERETDRKIDSCVKATDLKEVGPHTCLTIRGFFDGCTDDCWAPGMGVAAPAGMASKLAAQEMAQGRTASLQVTKKGKEVKVNCVQLAAEISQAHTFKTFKDTDEIVIYRDGIYQGGGHVVIKEEVEARLGQFSTERRAAETVYHIRVSSYASREDFNRPGHFVNLNNGILDLNTQQLLPHSPQLLTTIRVPVTYDPKAKCPTVTRFLEEVLPPDNVATFLQLAGYCLESDYHISRAFLFTGEGANGKCQKAGDQVLMADGSWKNIENIAIGDYVVSPQENGTSILARVKRTHSFFSPDVYEIRETTRKKRLLYTCAGSHELPLIREYSERTSKDDSTPRQCERRLFTYTAEHLSRVHSDKSAYCSFTTTPVEWSQKKDPTIDPYCLGVFLGDGNFVKGKKLSVCTSDDSFPEVFRRAYPLAHLRVEPHERCATYCFSIVSSFATELAYLGLVDKTSGDKFIPTDCLRASLNYRRCLLAGLLDTDGYVDKNGAVYYCTKSERMAADLRNLVFSLGGYASIRPITKTIKSYGFEGSYFETSIQFKAWGDLPLLRAFRADRLKIRRNNPRHVAVEAVRTDAQMVYGFEIDSPSHWYVTNNWMVTHNSVTIELLRTFLGKANCTTVPLQQLENSRFASSGLYGKLANLYADLPSTAMNHVGIFKMLTGGDSINAERKFQNSFDFYNHAKLIFSANQLPEVRGEDSLAFWRRWIIVRFPNQFLGDKADKHILRKLTAESELSGFLNLALASLQELRGRGEFSGAKDPEETAQQYSKSASPIVAFVTDCCTLEAEAWTSKDTIYGAYKEFCDLTGMPIKGKENFGRALAGSIYGNQVKSDRQRVMGELTHGWKGLRINTNGTEPSKDVGTVGTEENDQLAF